MGQEMRLPGLSLFMGDGDKEVRRYTVAEMRFRAMVKSQLTEEAFRTAKCEEFAVDDIVLRELSPYERENHSGIPQSTSMRFVPLWSGPCKIVSISTTNAQVHGLWSLPGSDVQVPLMKLKRFSAELPAVLKRVALKQLALEHPRFAKLPATDWKSFGKTEALSEGREHVVSYRPSTEKRTVKKRRQEVFDECSNPVGGD